MGNRTSPEKPGAKRLRKLLWDQKFPGEQEVQQRTIECLSHLPPIDRSDPESYRAAVIEALIREGNAYADSLTLLLAQFLKYSFNLLLEGEPATEFTKALKGLRWKLPHLIQRSHPGPDEPNTFNPLPKTTAWIISQVIHSFGHECTPENIDTLRFLIAEAGEAVPKTHDHGTGESTYFSDYERESRSFTLIEAELDRKYAEKLMNRIRSRIENVFENPEDIIPWLDQPGLSEDIEQMFVNHRAYLRGGNGAREDIANAQKAATLKRLRLDQLSERGIEFVERCLGKRVPIDISRTLIVDDVLETTVNRLKQLKPSWVVEATLDGLRLVRIYVTPTEAHDVGKEHVMRADENMARSLAVETLSVIEDLEVLFQFLKPNPELVVIAQAS